MNVSGYPQARVLVIDDEADLRETLADLLEEEGFSTEQAANGVQALALLRAEAPRPDVILLDLMMPEMSGWQFRDEQLADPELASIPVVVMSAVDASGVDADVKLKKPFDVRHLLSSVERLVARGAAG